MSAEDPQTTREWLMRIDTKVDKLLICQEDHETRIRAVETQHNQWLGRDGAIVAGISATFTVIGLAIQNWRG
jgi:hypothetical protein